MAAKVFSSLSQPVETGWKNIALEVFKELKGEDEYDKIMKKIMKEPPAPGIFSKARIDLNLTGFYMAFGAKALLSKRRPSHPYGFGAYGKVQMVDNPKFPEHEFFMPGRVFPVRLRHANLTFDDDGKSDFRSAALKFADSDEDTTFDLVMSTGRSNIFTDTQSLWDALNGARGGMSYKDYCLLNPLYMYGVIETIRRPPDSYVDQVYYAHLPFNFIAKDGKKRYVKFRMINNEGLAETGLLTEEEQREVWERERYPDEKRPKDYLKNEYEDRLQKGPIHYKLQLQLHEARQDDSQHVFNSAVHWDVTAHPWLDFADVTITTMLPDDVIERTSFNPVNKPPSLCMTGPPKTIYDFNCIPYYRSLVYKRSHALRSLRSPHSEEDSMCTYMIQVETGDVKNAGTDATITMALTGSKGRTDFLVLDKTLHNDFERGQIDEYTIKAMDVGELYLIHFHNDRGGLMSKKPDWFVNKVTILKKGSVKYYNFPCYSWILKEFVAFEGAGILPQKEQPEVVKIERQLEIKERQKQYRWFPESKKIPDLPGYIHAIEHDDIPKPSQFTDPSLKCFLNGRKVAKLNLGLALILNLFEPWDDFDDFKSMYKTWVISDRPKYAEGDAWMKDSVFGMQYLNGVNPLQIERCNKIPERFPVTQADVENSLDRGLTLKQEIKAGHIYIADYSILDGIRRNGHGTDKLRYVTEPLVLLYVNSKGDLVPIAIQLFQKPSTENPIWTPNDDKLDWLFAKMWAKAADAQIHQLVTHLLRTHLIVEGLALAAWRNLPSIHPVFKLLYPHLRSVMAINTLGRKGLISEGGVSDKTLSVGGGGHIQLMQKCYKMFSWDMMDIPAHLETMGLMDREALPNFHYRDDALALWEAITKFISDIVHLYYHNNQDVSQDTELQAWIKDIHDNGYKQMEGHVDHKFPSSLKSRDDLIQLLTRIIFTCSCQHAAVNFGQLDTYAFLPNCPASMHQPPPTKKGETTMEKIMKALPEKAQTGAQIGTVHLLTRFAKDEKFLGDYSDGLFVDHPALEAIDKFQDNLEKISDSIKNRNKSLEWPYIYLLPERVPNSVAI